MHEIAVGAVPNFVRNIGAVDGKFIDVYNTAYKDSTVP